MNKDGVKSHTKIPDDRSEKAERNCDCQCCLGIQSAGDGVSCSQDTCQCHIRRHGAACRDESEVDQVDRCTDHGSLNRISEDQTGDHAAYQRSLQYPQRYEGDVRLRDPVQYSTQKCLYNTHCFLPFLYGC